MPHCSFEGFSENCSECVKFENVSGIPDRMQQLQALNLLVLLLPDVHRRTLLVSMSNKKIPLF